jgi:hypothetical protein
LSVAGTPLPSCACEPHLQPLSGIFVAKKLLLKRRMKFGERIALFLFAETRCDDSKSPLSQT